MFFKQKILPKINWNFKSNYKYFPIISNTSNEINKILKTSSLPVFIYDLDIVKNRFNLLKNKLQTKWGNNIIAFSFKTNYEIAKSGIIKNLKGYAEVVSSYEYKMALKLGYHPKQIVLNGPNKTFSLLLFAIDHNSIVNLDNWQEIISIVKIQKILNKKIEVGIRINVKLENIKKSRFGFDEKETNNVINFISKSKNISINCIHIHIGSDINSPLTYREAAEKTSNLINLNNLNIKYIDFGGGFPGHGQSPIGSKQWDNNHINNFIDAITKPLSKIKFTNKPTLILEPGRYLCDDAGLVISKVINSYMKNGQQLITQQASNTMIPLSWYRPQIIKAYNKKLQPLSTSSNKLLTSIIYGSTCQENDKLYNGDFPSVNPGDLLFYFCVGAYNQNMSSEFIYKKSKTFFLNQRLR